MPGGAAKCQGGLFPTVPILGIRGKVKEGGREKNCNVRCNCSMYISYNMLLYPTMSSFVIRAG